MKVTLVKREEEMTDYGFFESGEKITTVDWQLDNGSDNRR